MQKPSLGQRDSEPGIHVNNKIPEPGARCSACRSLVPQHSALIVSGHNRFQPKHSPVALEGNKPSCGKFASMRYRPILCGEACTPSCLQHQWRKHYYSCRSLRWGKGILTPGSRRRKNQPIPRVRNLVFSFYWRLPGVPIWCIYIFTA